MVAILYLSRSMIGGWASFTAHLSLTTGWKIYRLTKRTEKNERSFGYGCTYRNVSKIPDGPILVSAVGKHFIPHLKTLPDGTTLVIHDPTEFRSKIVCNELMRFRVVVIRESMKQLLPNAIFLRHPFFQFPKTERQPTHPVSISRIDFDKNSHLLVEANALGAGIAIWGFANRLYLHHSGIDLGAAYRGQFAKSFSAVGEILSTASHVVDMSTIFRDGGGSQYTFLEAIYFGVPLILHKRWVEHPNSIFKDGVNCRAVETGAELAEALKLPPLFAGELLEPHLTVSWRGLFPSA